MIYSKSLHPHRIPSVLALMMLLPLIATAQTTISDAVIWSQSNSELESIVQRLGSARNDLAFEPWVELERTFDIAIAPDIVIEVNSVAEYYGNTEEVQSKGYFEIYYNSVSDVVNVLTAVIIKPDGRVLEVNPSTVQVTDTNSFDTFTNSQRVFIPLTNLAANDIAYFEYERTTRKDALPLPWSRIIYPRRAVRTQQFNATVSWSGESQVPVWSSNFEDLDCAELDRRVECSASNIPSLSIDPDVIYEDILPRLVFSASSSWSQLAEQVRSMVEQAVDSSPQIVSQAEMLISGLTDEKQKIQAIHEFVSREVRYVSLSQGNHTVVPHNSTETLDNRFGDCKDKTVLLIDLLRQIDVQASPVLVSTTLFNPDQLIQPASNYFDHMVACGTTSDGEQFCLDATDPYTDAFSVSAGLQGAASFYVDNATTGSIPADEFLWRFNLASSVQFLDNGGQIEEMNREFLGPYAGYMRSALMGMTEEERMRWGRESYNQVVGGEPEVEVSITGLTAQSEPVVISSTSTFDPLVDVRSDLIYSEDSFWMVDLLSGFASNNVFYDYEFPGMRYEAAQIFDLVGRWGGFSLGANLDINSRFGTLQRAYSYEETRILVRTRLEMPATTVRVSDLRAFHRFLEVLQQESVIRFGGALTRNSQ